KWQLDGHKQRRRETEGAGQHHHCFPAMHRRPYASRTIQPFVYWEVDVEGAFQIGKKVASIRGSIGIGPFAALAGGEAKFRYHLEVVAKQQLCRLLYRRHLGGSRRSAGGRRQLAIDVGYALASGSELTGEDA